MSYKFQTPVGRIVWGDTHTAQTKNQQGQEFRNKANQPFVKYNFGLAIAKSSPEFIALWNAVRADAVAAAPQSANTATFSWKMKDGDSPELNQRDGYAGNFILAFSTTLQPKTFSRLSGTSVPCDPKDIKRGYYVRVAGSSEYNNQPLKPGIFMNANAVELVAYGPEIVVNHFDAAPIGALPAGASMVPVVSGPMPATPAAAPVTPWQPTTGPAAPIQPQCQAPTGPTSTAAAPNYAFLNGPKRYLVNGVVYTADQLAAAGWPTDQITMLPPA